MMTHTHTMHLLSDIPLTLPTFGGRVEKLMHFECTCGWYSTITGEFAVGTAHTHAQLVARARQERDDLSPYGAVVRANERLLQRQRRQTRG